MDQIKDLQTPCFILDPVELARSVKGFQNALKTNFNNSIVSYSVKTNSVPKCIMLACEMGAYAEVVSSDEYELALLCGFKKNNIVYNGPIKSKETFLEAITNGAIVNIEANRELKWLQDLPKCGHYKVGIRLNVNISNISLEDADGDNDNSRFGFSDETSEFEDALSVIDRLENVELAGLHIHRTAHSRSIRFYKRLIEYACKTIEKYSLALDYLDVGGGYFGIFPNKPSYYEYACTFCEVLKAHGLQDLCVIVEPGNALVASCFSFMSEVIDVKHVEENLWFVTTDGSRNDVDPFYKKSGYLMNILYLDSDRKFVPKQIVSGCTCLEYDRMHTLEGKPLLMVGDRLQYYNVGAYTMSLTPMFIRYLPMIYMKTEHGFEIIRDKWTAQEYTIKNNY